jgi:ribonuclease Z
VSSVYVSVPSFGGLLMDSGEGSFGQLARRFGTERALRVVAELQVVLISHMHADHHLGLLRILAIRQELIAASRWNSKKPETSAAEAEEEEALVVVGPPALKEWLDEYSSQIERLAYRFVSCHALNQPQHPVRYLSRASPPRHTRLWQCLRVVCAACRVSCGVCRVSCGVCRVSCVVCRRGHLERSLGLVEVRSTEVVHCPFAYGFALTHQSGWKIVYSGTAPALRPHDAGFRG